MKIAQVAYRRKFNLGNYETMDIELVADVEPGEQVKDVLDSLVREAKDWKKEKERSKA